MKEKVALIYADQNGVMQEDSDLLAVGLNGRQVEVANPAWMDLPPGGEVLLMPGRLPMGYNQDSGEIEVVEAVTAVAAILPVGLTRCLLPGYEIQQMQELPLYGYTAVGSSQGRLKVAALQTDEDLKWNPVYYNTPNLAQLISCKKKNFPENRLVAQLAKCALEYHCLTAQNIFYGRWEAGIPVSPVCNANCLGCISKQPSECCPSPQGRIDFIPTVPEIVELAVAHLETAVDAIISFGQGCEGEPSLQREILAEAVRGIRKRTTKGTININSNAGYFNSIRELVDAGLDSIRVSLFSAIRENYDWYHSPEGYQLADVIRSLRYAADHGLMTALNLLFFPGFANQRNETKALYELINETGVRQVQLRNLNLDPEKLNEKIGDEELPTIEDWLIHCKLNFPNLLISNYSRPKA